MQIGLLGLPNSGKTTIFNALTHSEAEVGAYANSKAEPNVAVVEVGDERITRLTQLYHPKKTTYATIEIVDFAGLTKGSARKDDFFSAQMNLVRNLDAIALVTRNFSDELMGSPAPLADIDTIDTEFILSDMIITEKRLERIGGKPPLRGGLFNVISQCVNAPGAPEFVPTRQIVALHL